MKTHPTLNVLQPGRRNLMAECMGREAVPAESRCVMAANEEAKRVAWFCVVVGVVGTTWLEMDVRGSGHWVAVLRLPRLAAAAAALAFEDGWMDGWLGGCVVVTWLWSTRPDHPKSSIIISPSCNKQLPLAGGVVAIYATHCTTAIALISHRWGERKFRAG